MGRRSRNGRAREVLVFGNDARTFLAVVRSLGRHGLEVHACPFDQASPALRSRHITAVHRLDPYNLNPEAWVRAVRSLLEAHRYTLVVPCDDRSILPLHRHAEQWGGTRIALPGAAAFDAFFDKGATRDLAVRAGVGVAAAFPFARSMNPRRTCDQQNASVMPSFVAAGVL